MMGNSDALDPRVIRTRQLIHDAFIELIQEVEFKKISVNLITKKAGINRVTFYLHYKDLDDMIECLVDDMIDNIEEILRENDNKNDSPDLVSTTLTQLLEYIASHAKVYKVLLISKKIPVFTPQFIELIVNLILRNIEKYEITQPTDRVSNENVPKDITAWYGASAMVGTISIGLANNMPYSPHYLASQIAKINLFNRVI